MGLLDTMLAGPRAVLSLATDVVMEGVPKAIESGNPLEIVSGAFGIKANTDIINEIVTKGVTHVFPLERRDQIVISNTLGSSTTGNAIVHLKSGGFYRGDGLFPSYRGTAGRALRDLTVLDTNQSNFGKPRHLIYCFLGAPSDSQIKENLFQIKNPVMLRINGRELIDQVDRDNIFYRRQDKALMIGGEYRGPAFIDWEYLNKGEKKP